MSQNIFDNEEFFKNYKELREKQNNYNNLVEQPAIKELLPDLHGKSVLDLGCGFGGNCIDFINRGASSVLGIDISRKMIEKAKQENTHPCIEYKTMDICDISSLSRKFDLVFSSLAFHYINNFGELIENIRNLLNKGGILLFSQEHPITTAPKMGPTWTKDEEGNKI